MNQLIVIVWKVVVWICAAASVVCLPLAICCAQEGIAPIRATPRGESSRPAVPHGGASPLAARLTFPDVTSASSRDRPTITIHSAPWCGHCVEMQREIGDGGDVMAIQWTDDPIPEGIVAHERRQGRVALLPCAVWMGANGHTQYLIGRHTLAQLESSYWKTHPGADATQLTMTGEPPVGRLSGLDLQAVIDRVRASGVTSATIHWRRDAPASLIVGRPWSLLDVIGTSGSVSVDVEVPSWPIKQASFDYRFNGESITLDAGPVSIPLRSVGSSDDRVTGDPLSIAFGAISLIRMLLPLLSPTISIDLPRELVVTLDVQSDSLHVAFRDGPAVSIKSIITLRRKLTGVSITAESVVAEFDQSRWWKRITILSGADR